MQTVNELQVRKAELQKSLTPDVDSMGIDIETVKIVFEYQETQDDVDDAKVYAPYRAKKIAWKLWPTEAKRARNRIDARKTRARKAAKLAKVKALEVLKAELAGEVKALQARKAALPGSAVFHS